VSRAVAFGRTYNAPSTPDSGKEEGAKNRETSVIMGEDMFLDKTKILQLIMQHLYHEGLKHSAHVLSGETNTDCTPDLTPVCTSASELTRSCAVVRVRALRHQTW
jgi:hypothetical protein